MKIKTEFSPGQMVVAKTSSSNRWEYVRIDSMDIKAVYNIRGYVGLDVDYYDIERRCLTDVMTKRKFLKKHKGDVEMVIASMFDDKKGR